MQRSRNSSSFSLGVEESRIMENSRSCLHPVSTHSNGFSAVGSSSNVLTSSSESAPLLLSDPSAHKFSTDDYCEIETALSPFPTSMPSCDGLSSLSAMKLYEGPSLLFYGSGETCCCSSSSSSSSNVANTPTFSESYQYTNPVLHSSPSLRVSTLGANNDMSLKSHLPAFDKNYTPCALTSSHVSMLQNLQLPSGLLDVLLKNPNQSLIASLLLTLLCLVDCNGHTCNAFCKEATAPFLHRYPFHFNSPRRKKNELIHRNQQLRTFFAGNRKQQLNEHTASEASYDTTLTATTETNRTLCLQTVENDDHDSFDGKGIDVYIVLGLLLLFLFVIKRYQDKTANCIIDRNSNYNNLYNEQIQQECALHNNKTRACTEALPPTHELSKSACWHDFENYENNNYSEGVCLKNEHNFCSNKVTPLNEKTLFCRRINDYAVSENLINKRSYSSMRDCNNLNNNVCNHDLKNITRDHEVNGTLQRDSGCDSCYSTNPYSFGLHRKKDESDCLNSDHKPRQDLTNCQFNCQRMQNDLSEYNSKKRRLNVYCQQPCFCVQHTKGVKIEQQGPQAFTDYFRNKEVTAIGDDAEGLNALDYESSCHSCNNSEEALECPVTPNSVLSGYHGDDDASSGLSYSEEDDDGSYYDDDNGENRHVYHCKNFNNKPVYEEESLSRFVSGNDNNIVTLSCSNKSSASTQILTQGKSQANQQLSSTLFLSSAPTAPVTNESNSCINRKNFLEKKDQLALPGINNSCVNLGQFDTNPKNPSERQEHPKGVDKLNSDLANTSPSWFLSPSTNYCQSACPIAQLHCYEKSQKLQQFPVFMQPSTKPNLEAIDVGSAVRASLEMYSKDNRVEFQKNNTPHFNNAYDESALKASLASLTTSEELRTDGPNGFVINKNVLFSSHSLKKTEPVAILSHRVHLPVSTLLSSQKDSITTSDGNTMTKELRFDPAEASEIFDPSSTKLNNMQPSVDVEKKKVLLNDLESSYPTRKRLNEALSSSACTSSRNNEQKPRKRLCEYLSETFYSKLDRKDGNENIFSLPYVTAPSSKLYFGGSFPLNTALSATQKQVTLPDLSTKSRVESLLQLRTQEPQHQHLLPSNHGFCQHGYPHTMSEQKRLQRQRLYSTSSHCTVEPTLAQETTKSSRIHCYPTATPSYFPAPHSLVSEFDTMENRVLNTAGAVSFTVSNEQPNNCNYREAESGILSCPKVQNCSYSELDKRIPASQALLQNGFLKAPKFAPICIVPHPLLCNYLKPVMNFDASYERFFIGAAYVRHLIRRDFVLSPTRFFPPTAATPGNTKATTIAAASLLACENLKKIFEPLVNITFPFNAVSSKFPNYLLLDAVALFRQFAFALSLGLEHRGAAFFNRDDDKQLRASLSPYIFRHLPQCIFSDQCGATKDSSSVSTYCKGMSHCHYSQANHRNILSNFSLDSTTNNCHHYHPARYLLFLLTGSCLLLSCDLNESCDSRVNTAILQRFYSYAYTHFLTKTANTVPHHPLYINCEKTDNNGGYRYTGFEFNCTEAVHLPYAVARRGDNGNGWSKALPGKSNAVRNPSDMLLLNRSTLDRDLRETRLVVCELLQWDINVGGIRQWLEVIIIRMALHHVRICGENDEALGTPSDFSGGGSSPQLLCRTNSVGTVKCSSSSITLQNSYMNLWIKMYFEAEQVAAQESFCQRYLFDWATTQLELAIQCLSTVIVGRHSFRPFLSLLEDVAAELVLLQNDIVQCDSHL